MTVIDCLWSLLRYIRRWLLASLHRCPGQGLWRGREASGPQCHKSQIVTMSWRFMTFQSLCYIYIYMCVCPMSVITICFNMFHVTLHIESVPTKEWLDVLDAILDCQGLQVFTGVGWSLPLWNVADIDSEDCLVPWWRWWSQRLTADLIDAICGRMQMATQTWVMIMRSRCQGLAGSDLMSTEHKTRQVHVVQGNGMSLLAWGKTCGSKMARRSHSCCIARPKQWQHRYEHPLEAEKAPAKQPLSQACVFVAGLLTSITSIFCWNWCWRMQNDAKHSCRNISDIDRLRTAALCGERL